MSNDYTFITDLNDLQYDQIQPSPSAHKPLKYYMNNDSDSDSDSEEDSGIEDNQDWTHYYGVATLIALAIILYYVIKIRKELSELYEE